MIKYLTKKLPQKTFIDFFKTLNTHKKKKKENLLS